MNEPKGTETSFSPWWASWWKPIQSTVLGRILLILTFWLWIPYFIVAVILHAVFYELAFKFTRFIAINVWTNILRPSWRWITTGRAT